MLAGIDTADGPRFAVSEVAKMFFARSAHWVRWRERKGHFHLNEQAVGTSRTASGARQYSLSDVEQMAHALRSRGDISQGQFRDACAVVKAEARLYGYLR
jgi:hypothetical protein